MNKTAIAMALAAALLAPTTAVAYDRDHWPYAWRDCPTVDRKGITYVLVNDPDYGPFASVVDIAPNKRTVTIPPCVFEGGRRYDVGSVCEETLSDCEGLKDVYLLADLQECDDMTLFLKDDRDVAIHVYTEDDLSWLTREGNDSRVVTEW